MKNLVAYMLLSALAINMTPGKNFRRYISLACGLIMILLLISPVVNILGGDDSELIEKINEIENYLNLSDDIDYRLEDIIGASGEAESFLAEFPDYEAAGGEASLGTGLKGMGAELADIEITKDKNGEILRIIVIVKKLSEEDGADMKSGSLDDVEVTENQFQEMVKEYISEIYKLDTDDIYVVVR
jgi:hypothetical protein